MIFTNDKHSIYKNKWQALLIFQWSTVFQLIQISFMLASQIFMFRYSGRFQNEITQNIFILCLVDARNNGGYISGKVCRNVLFPTQVCRNFTVSDWSVFQQMQENSKCGGIFQLVHSSSCSCTFFLFSCIRLGLSWEISRPVFVVSLFCTQCFHLS